MNNTMESKIWVNSGDIESMIASVHDMSEALYRSAYTVTAQYVLDGGGAADFVRDHMDMTGAALRMIASTTAMISAGIANGEIMVALSDDPKET